MNGVCQNDAYIALNGFTGLDFHLRGNDDPSWHRLLTGARRRSTNRPSRFTGKSSAIRVPTDREDVNTN